ncbi:MAG: DUF4238 domain-containing protein [Candidatus Dojkabacteria bacterium]
MKNHYNPRVYLRRFFNSQDVHAYNKNRKKSYEKAIGAVSFKEYLYRIPKKLLAAFSEEIDREGFLERFYQLSIENNYNDNFASIAKSLIEQVPINKNTLDYFEHFLLIQGLRTPIARDKLQQILKDHPEQKEKIHSIGVNLGESWNEDEITFLFFLMYTIDDRMRANLAKSLGFQRKRLQFIVNRSSQKFIANDNIFVNLPDPKNEEETTFAYPINQSIMLAVVTTENAADGVFVFETEDERTVNFFDKHIHRQAQEFVYSSKDNCVYYENDLKSIPFRKLHRKLWEGEIYKLQIADEEI